MGWNTKICVQCGEEYKVRSCWDKPGRISLCCSTLCKNIYAGLKAKEKGTIPIFYGKEHPMFGSKRVSPMEGKRHSKKAKIKMRLSRIRFLNERFGGGICPTYNPIGCRIINEYGQKHGLHFRHAESGGEFFVKGLGYWVDGYDEKKNVVIEYYEEYHKYQKEHDNERRKSIMKTLGCKFIEMWYDGRVVINS